VAKSERSRVFQKFVMVSSVSKKERGMSLGGSMRLVLDGDKKTDKDKRQEEKGKIIIDNRWFM